jgi:hypothetical protein
MAIDPFVKTYTAQETITESKNFYQHQKFDIQISNLFTVKFTYTFNKGQKVKKLERQNAVESDGGKSLF